MDEAIQDSVAEGGVADNVVSMFEGDLAGDDGRGATVAIIKDLQKVAPFGRVENRKAPVIEDQELNATEGFEQAATSAVAASQGERLEQARDASRFAMPLSILPTRCQAATLQISHHHLQRKPLAKSHSEKTPQLAAETAKNFALSVANSRNCGR